jgi:hypothetical protein
LVAENGELIVLCLGTMRQEEQEQEATAKTGILEDEKR